uniref:Uncharacterized protein n=1 Tax=Rangifer tarandus platyrhynchus TaxID=3082113 RepID=A0ACB0EVT0_RANTA|nr:unnamed protein product [Rangifer tarandus platyrhynchus]
MGSHREHRRRPGRTHSQQGLPAAQGLRGHEGGGRWLRGGPGSDLSTLPAQAQAWGQDPEDGQRVPQPTEACGELSARPARADAGGVHACCPGTSHGSLPTAPGSPKPATAMSSNLKHSPSNLKGSIPSRSPARVSMWLLAAKPPSRGRGAGLGLPALFGFPLPALEPQTPVWSWRRPDPGKGTKTLHSWAGESLSRGKRCRRARAPAPTHGPCPHSTGAPAGLLLAPELLHCSFRAPSSGWDRQRDPDFIRGTRAQRDMHTPKHHEPPEPHIRVGLQQAAELRPGAPGGTADPYDRLSLSPDAGRTHETKVRRGTLCPVLKETCSLHRGRGWARGPGRAAHTPPRVPPAGLPLDRRHRSQHRPLGALSLLLRSGICGTCRSSGAQRGLPAPGSRPPPGSACCGGAEALSCCLQPEQTAELCSSLRCVPSSGRLTVVVLEARGPSPALVGER